MIRFVILLALMVAASVLSPGAVAAAPRASAATVRGAPRRRNVTVEPEAGGTHIRVVTAAGPVHLFRPAGYDRRGAGTVVYVHGYYVHVDGAWREHRLARQFAASRRNALFVAPEAPAAAEEKPAWPQLRRMLTAALRTAGVVQPRGPLVVVGHSGAYRTIVPWLDEASLHHLILVDALYGNEADFQAWMNRSPANQLTLIVKGTAKWADPFVRALPYAVTVPAIPSRIEQLSRAERGARLLCMQSQYGHFELITEGKVLPVLLRRADLPPLRRSGTRP